MGARNAGNPHVACDVAGAGNMEWSRCCDTRKRKSETTGNTNFDLNRRASPRPYFTAAVRTASGESTKMRSFDPNAEETLFFPRLVGG